MGVKQNNILRASVSSPAPGRLPVGVHQSFPCRLSFFWDLNTQRPRAGTGIPNQFLCDWSELRREVKELLRKQNERQLL